MTMGSKIRAARKAKGLTIDALATQIGGTAAQLSRVETGARGPSVDLLKRIMDALNIHGPERDALVKEVLNLPTGLMSDDVQTVHE